MVVTKRRVSAGQAGIVFQDIVHVELLECEESGVRLRIGDYGLVPHYACYIGVEVETVAEAFDYIGSGKVAAVAGEEAMVCERVKHRTGSADWRVLVEVRESCGNHAQSLGPPGIHACGFVVPY